MRPPRFSDTLAAHGLELRKAKTENLQVNVGRLCNLACRHCHLEAGPQRTEVMRRETMDEIIALARRFPFASVDITGGAPELNPDIAHLLKGLGPLAPQRIFRTNLLALEGRDDLLDLLVTGGWNIGASLPAVNAGQVASIRGPGVFEKSLDMLRRLNSLGYGQGNGLLLHLVSNPAGAFLPPSQEAAGRAFQVALDGRGIAFDSLLSFANVPLGRFRQWLARTGNLDSYMSLLRERFNPGVVGGLMCRSILSVAFDGHLYDCDFNLAARLPARRPGHVRELALPREGARIATNDYCYACTAGAGFT